MLRFEKSLIEDFKRYNTVKSQIMLAYMQGYSMHDLEMKGYKKTNIKDVRLVAYEFALKPEHVYTIYTRNYQYGFNTKDKETFHSINGKLTDYDGEDTIVWHVQNVSSFYRSIHGGFLGIFDPYPISERRLSRGRFLANNLNIIACDLSYEDFVRQIVKMGDYEEKQVTRRVIYNTVA